MKKLFLDWNTDFSRNILTLFTGNAIAFIIPILLYPVLSRVFTVEDYALFGLYVGIFSLLEIASAGRYDFGIVLPEKEEDAVSLVWGGMIIAAAYSILILILVVIFNDVVAGLLKNPELSGWLFLLPPSLFLISASKLCNGWLLRAKRFRAASVNKASQKIGEVSSQLIFGTMRAGNGLILGDLAGRFFNAVFSVYQSRLGIFGKPLSIKANLLRYSELPTYGIFPAMLNNLGGLWPVLVISAYYSVDVTGSVNFSRIVLSVPFALIVTGISQVLMQQVSELKNRKESIRGNLVSLVAKLSGLSVLAVIALYGFGPSLFEWIFGGKWREAGEYTSILIFSTAVSFVVSPFSTILVVLGRIKWLSYWQIFYFFAVSTLWFWRDVPIQNFLWVVVLIDILSYLAYGILIYKAVETYESQLSTHS